MSSEDKLSIYKLDLFESLTLHSNFRHSILITRVPGGWIYQKEIRDHLSLVFIPFDTEFMPE